MLLIHLHFFSSPSFVFIIEISYILFHLMPRDKCLRCVSFICYLWTSTSVSLLSCDICSRDSGKWITAREAEARAVFGKILRKISTCFSFALSRLSQSVLSSALPRNVMNENVFYVILHNIIVFNKQTPLSLHLFVKRNSQNLSARSRFTHS